MNSSVFSPIVPPIVPSGIVPFVSPFGIAPCYCCGQSNVPLVTCGLETQTQNENHPLPANQKSNQPSPANQNQNHPCPKKHNRQVRLWFRFKGGKGGAKRGAKGRAKCHGPDMIEKFVYLDRGPHKRTAADFQHFKSTVCRGLDLSDCSLVNRQGQLVNSIQELIPYTLTKECIRVANPIFLSPAGDSDSEEEIYRYSTAHTEAEKIESAARIAARTTDSWEDCICS
jgi:hypothetical protein